MSVECRAQLVQRTKETETIETILERKFAIEYTKIEQEE